MDIRSRPASSARFKVRERELGELKMDASMAATNLSHPEIASIFDDVFQHTGRITAATSPEEVERWDSLQHIALIRALETTFSIRLSMDEMMEIRSVGDIERVLARHGV